MTNANDHWEQIHRTKLDQVSWYQDQPTLALQMIDRASIPAGARAVDAGTGASRMVEAMLGRGFQPTLVDISQAALDRVRDRLGPQSGGVVFVPGSICEVALEAGAYDLWHDRAVFHFLTDSEDQRAYVAQVAKALRPGGTLVLSGFAPDGPEKCSGLQVCRHRPEDLKTLFGASFRWEEEGMEQHATPFGTTQSFLVTRFTRV
jgi:SAM-dependent methyltransferase